MPEQRVVKALSVMFTAGLVVYLAWTLTALGWTRVLASVPATPWFYLAFAAFYFCSPVHEALALKLLWNCSPRRSFPVLIKKRVFSRQLLDYSGDAYLYLWACRNVGRPARELAHTIKDNVIISSATSTLVAIVALGALLVSGQLVLPAELLDHHGVRVVVGGAGALVLLILVVRWRRRILWLPRRMIALLAAIHASRLIFVLLLELLMWVTVDAGVPLRSWLSLLAVEIVITRIPFLPSRDLVLLGTGLGIAPGIHIASPLMAGMLLTVSILEKALGLVLLAVFAFLRPADREESGELPCADLQGDIP